MIGGTEKVGSINENSQMSIEKHPLEDTPSFEEHMCQVESTKADQLRNLQAGLEQAKQIMTKLQLRDTRMLLGELLVNRKAIPQLICRKNSSKINSNLKPFRLPR